MEVLFWSLLLFVGYTYIGYPLIIQAIAWIRPRAVLKNTAHEWPSVSIVVAVRNEESNIQKRLWNLLSQDYPSDKLEIVIVSDGSTDKTEAFVEEYVARKLPKNSGHVALVKYSPGRGKPHALKMGIRAANGSIVVFADARQRFAPQAIKELVRNMADPHVGAVSGELVITENEGSTRELPVNAYWKYEKWIRRTESKIGSVVGVTGAIYAIRKELFEEIPDETILDDVLIPMLVAANGYRVVFESGAIAYDVASPRISQEWRRKVRTLTGNWQLLSLRPSLLLPWKNPLFLSFVSHKIARLVVPWTLPFILVIGAMQFGVVYKLITTAQLIGYALAIGGHYVPWLAESKIVKICHLFVVLNLAASAALWYWATGRSGTLWKPATS